MRIRHVFAATLLLASLGCSGDEPAPAATDAPGATDAPAATEAPPCSLDGASTDARTGGTPADVALLRDVRINQDGCPRIVFEFGNVLPSYDVRYSDGPFEECGSGDEVDTSSWGAGAFLVAKHEPAMPVDLSTEDAAPTYTGSYDIDARGPIVERLREFCRFEGQMQWVIGLDRERAFRVSTLDGPARLVIDITER